MSSSASFKLTANEGRIDRLLQSTALLNQRINNIISRNTAINAQRGKNGQPLLQTTLPSLSQIEETHVLFFDAKFKPFVAMQNEYNKVRTQSGNTTLGSTVVFSIPQTGDFFNDCALHVGLSLFQSSTQTSPAAIQGGATYAYVDAFGNAIAPATADVYRNLVRWYEYPGERLVNTASFDVNGNKLDDYNSHVSVMDRNFFLNPIKETGYSRCNGQEIPSNGYSGPKRSPAYDPRGTTPALPFTTLIPAAAYNQAVPLLVDPLDALNGSRVDTWREKKEVLNGPQTPKLTQPALDLWIRLKFWFCEDLRLAVPSVSIPYGQRYITIKFEEQANIVAEYQNIYVKTITAGGGNVAEEYTYYDPTTNTTIFSAGTMDTITIPTIELYVDSFYVNSDIHDIFLSQIHFALVRIHKYQRVQITSASSDQQLAQLKFPIETIMAGFMPVYNDDTTNTFFRYRDWHRFSRMVNGTDVGREVFLLTAATSTTRTDITPSVYEIQVPTIDSLSVTSQGVVLFEDTGSTFYNAYQSYNFGEYTVRTPTDKGALFINFCPYPGLYQPSGYLNFSRARETFIKWNSSFIDSSNPVYLVVVAKAINFFLITDGSAVMRYST